jgi:DDE superfamily endonuclease
MEDVLDLYGESFDPKRPQVCFDERPYQLVAETRLPLAGGPGQPERYDYEYQRKGTCNLFTFFQPLADWRHVKVTQHRTKQDFAHCMKELVDVHFPEANIIRVVLDNLNIHTPAALYETFPAEEARRILRKLEFHPTPMHGSWLNMVEIELSVLANQCLDRRLPDVVTLEKEIAVWERERNDQGATVNWRFTVADARTKLERFYPS